MVERSPLKMQKTKMQKKFEGAKKVENAKSRRCKKSKMQEVEDSSAKMQTKLKMEESLPNGAYFFEATKSFSREEHYQSQTVTLGCICSL